MDPSTIADILTVVRTKRDDVKGKVLHYAATVQYFNFADLRHVAGQLEALDGMVAYLQGLLDKVTNE